MTDSTTPNLDTAQRVDFDRLGALVAERITALRFVVSGLDTLQPTPAGAAQLPNIDAVKDAICRDMVMPWVHLLAQFVQATQVQEHDADDGADA